MKTDSIFYKLFQRFPRIFFELIGQLPEHPEAYRFTSVEIKQPTFRMDGLLKLPDDTIDEPVYIIEVQFQPKPDFYWRLFAEISLYLEQEKPERDWQAVAIFAKRSLDPGVPRQYRGFLMSEQVTRIYLDELGPAADQSVGLGMIQLIVEPPATAVERSRRLIQQAQQALREEAIAHDVLELIKTIVFYKFKNLSSKEIEEMFGLSDLKQTRVYQEGKEEGKLETIPLFLQLGLTVEQVEEMLSLNEFKTTRFYQEVQEESLLEKVPRLLALGLTVEQLAQTLDLDIEVVRQAASLSGYDTDRGENTVN